MNDRTSLRNTVKRWWRSFEWPFIIGLGLLTTTLGFIGIKKHFLIIGEEHSFLDILYRTLQLFVLDAGATEGFQPPLQWELNTGRFLAPVVAAYTALRALAVIFSEQLKSFRLGLLNGHVVICGLGRKGLLFAKRFLDRGESVVVIELDADNDMIESCREYGAVILIGNAADRNLLQKVRVNKAKYLISVCGDDGVNAEVAVHAHELVRDNKGNVLTCLIHIVDPQLCSLLREQEIETQKVDAFRLEFFNVFESGTRALLNEFPAFSPKSETHSNRPHILIVGLGKMGESLLVQAARNWKPIHTATNNQLCITFIDNEAEIKKESLCLRYPQLDKICLLIDRQMDINSPEFKQARFLFDNQSHCDITSIYVCLSDDSFSLSTALILHKHIRNQEIPIVVRMTHDAGLATLLRGEDFSSGSFSNLHSFGLLDRTCKPELLIGGTIEILARAIHENYILNEKKKGETPETNPSMVSWDELPEHLKESNRSQASHIGIKLRAVKCRVEPLTDWEAELFQFTPEEIEKLADMEHERWCSEKIKNGWKYGTEKNNNKKTHPCLVKWNDLPVDEQKKDKDTILGLPSFLAAAGFEIYRINKPTNSEN